MEGKLNITDRDKELRILIQSLPEEKAPVELKNSIMSAVSAIPIKKIRRNLLPAWFRIGIPTLLMGCFLLTAIYSIPEIKEVNSSSNMLFKSGLNHLNERVVGWFGHIRVPQINFNDQILLFIGSGILLFWLAVGVRGLMIRMRKRYYLLGEP